MNIFRKLLIDALEDNGGYGGNHRSDRYPIAFNVKVHGSCDVDRIIDKLAEGDPKQAKLARYLMDNDLIQWDGDSEWYWAVEQARESATDSDSYRTMSPTTATRFGLPYTRFPRKYKRRTNEGAFYPAGKPGWMSVDPYTAPRYDVKFAFAGRSGGYVVIDGFEGKQLRGMSTESLIDDIKDDDGGYTNEWCQALVAMIYEWDRCFTWKTATEAVRYQMAFSLNQIVEEWQEQMRDIREAKKATAREAIEVAYWHERDVMTEAA